MSEMQQSTDVSNETQGRILRDNYLVYVPLASTAVALAYDVGHFYAIGVDFFTLFSLSEHLVFSIQALPFAFMGIWLVAPIAEFVRSVPGFGGVAKIILLVVLALSISVSFAISLFADITSVRKLLILTVCLIASSIGVMIAGSVRPMMVVAWVSALALLTSFSIGANLQTDFRHVRPYTFHLKDGSAIGGQIIRSGERGMLIYDAAADELRFLLWDGINSIEAPLLKLNH